MKGFNLFFFLINKKIQISDLSYNILAFSSGYFISVLGFLKVTLLVFVVLVESGETKLLSIIKIIFEIKIYNFLYKKTQNLQFHK